MFQVDIRPTFSEDHKNQWSRKSEEEAQMIMIEIKDNTTIDLNMIRETTTEMIDTMITEGETTMAETITTAVAVVVVDNTAMTEEVTIETREETTIEDTRITITTIIEITITTRTERTIIKMIEVDLDRIRGITTIRKEDRVSIPILLVVHRLLSSINHRISQFRCNQICRQRHLFSRISKFNIECNSISKFNSRCHFQARHHQ